MKLNFFPPIAAAVCALAVPFSASAKDKHDKHDKHDSHHDDHRGSRVIIRSYPSYGYGYSPFYRPYPYSSGPTLGFSYYSRPSTVYRGQTVYRSYSDSLAVDVQQELRRRGYYRGPIDGDIGPGSRHAICAYQDDRGLAVTGRIDSSLLRSLGIR